MQKSYILLNPTNRYGLDIMDRAHARFGLLPGGGLDQPARGTVLARHPARACPAHLPQRDFTWITPRPNPWCACWATAWRFRASLRTPSTPWRRRRTCCSTLPPLWNSAELMRRFRDKNAVKEHLRATHPELPMNATRLGAQRGRCAVAAAARGLCDQTQRRHGQPGRGLFQGGRGAQRFGGLLRRQRGPRLYSRGFS